jgi:hypothetical protein
MLNGSIDSKMKVGKWMHFTMSLLTCILLLGTLPLSKVNVGGKEYRPDSSGDFILNNSLHPCHPAVSGWSLPMLALDARVHFYLSSKINIGGIMPKAIRLTPKHVQSTLCSLDVIHHQVKVIHQEMLTGIHDPMYISPSEILFNIGFEIEKLQMQFGKRVL